MSNILNLVVALNCEAQPLIESLDLLPYDRHDGIRLFGNNNIRLVISGIGKIASACAVGFIAGSEDPKTTRCWLNVGVAGHATLPIGSVGLAHEIVDIATAISHYPAIVFKAPCDSYRLSCHDHATTSYPVGAMCDMESSGYFASASRFTSVEFIHALKIVSDNSTTGLELVNKHIIRKLIEDHVPTIERIANLIRNHAEQHLPTVPTMPLEAVLAAHHYTTTQRLQLLEYARRWCVVKPNIVWPPKDIDNCRDSREVLAKINGILAATPLSLDRLSNGR